LVRAGHGELGVRGGTQIVAGEKEAGPDPVIDQGDVAINIDSRGASFETCPLLAIAHRGVEGVVESRVSRVEDERIVEILRVDRILLGRKAKRSEEEYAKKSFHRLIVRYPDSDSRPLVNSIL